MCVTKNAQTNCQCVSSQFIASKTQETHSRGNTEYRRNSQSKNGLYFPNFRQYFPNKVIFFRVCSFQSRPHHCAFGPFTGSLSKLDVCRDQIGALPILQVWKLCKKSQIENVFLPWLKPDVFIFTDYWLFGCVVLDPAVDYLGPRGVGSSNDLYKNNGKAHCRSAGTAESQRPS